MSAQSETVTTLSDQRDRNFISVPLWLPPIQVARWLVASATWVLEKSDDKIYCNWKMAFASVSRGPASNCSQQSHSLYRSTIYTLTMETD